MSKISSATRDTLMALRSKVAEDVGVCKTWGRT
jgi:hypothetical protein